MDQFEKLQLVFSTIYGKASKKDDIAEILFEEIINYLKNDRQFFKKAKQRQMLLSLLTKATDQSDQGTLKFIFKCEYCCSIVLRKPKKQSPIDMYIISPEKWSSGTHDWHKGNFDFCEPDDSTSIHLPQVAQHSKPLNVFYSTFKMELEKALVTLRNTQPNWQYTASTIEKACKVAVLQSKFSMVYDRIEDSSQQNQQTPQKIKTSAQGIALNNSEANTSWYIPANAVNKIISYSNKYRIFAKKLIIGFKAHLLRKVTNQRAEEGNYDQTQVGLFKKCFDELIFNYKLSISTQQSSVNRVDDFMQIIKKIHENLKVITRGGLTSKIDDFEAKKGQIRFEKPAKASIISIDETKHQNLDPILVDIPDYPLKVHKRLPFETLLQLAKEIENKQLTEKSKWILLTERTFFDITKQFTTDEDIIDLNIHMRQIQCQIGSTTLYSVVDKYEKIVQENEQHFGMGMIGQAKSHIQLIKTIAAIVAFELVKMNRQRLKSNLDSYRIPIDLQIFHSAFISHSYEARRAMRNILIYNQSRKNKNQIFKLDGGSSSFKKFAQLAAQQTRSSYIWKKNMQRIQQLNIELVYQQAKKSFAEKKLIDAFNSFRTYYNYTNYNNGIQTRINAINSGYYSVSSQYVLTQYHNQNPWLHAFLQNISSDVLGLIKILMLAQNPKKDNTPSTNNLFVNNLQHEQFPMQIYSQKPNIPTRTLDSQSISVLKIPVITQFNDVQIIFNNSSIGNEMNQYTFQHYRELFHSKQKNQQYKQNGSHFEYILSPPSDQDNRDREHQLYARQDEKPDNIQTQDFLAIGNVRSANHTQLMVLCKNILDKKITSNSFNKECLLAEETILQTAGQLSTYNPRIQQEYKQIRMLLKNFIDGWAFTDTKFCPILGPFFGYIGRQVIDDRLFECKNKQQEKKYIRKAVIDLCKKCIDEFERGQSELQNNSDLKIQWDQRFAITAAICCLRETILEHDQQEQIQILSRLIFLLRSSAILSDQQPKPKFKDQQTDKLEEIREFEKELLFSIQKTIFYNIEVVSSFLQQHHECIGKIVKKMDLDYSDKIQWKRNNIFSFQGRQTNIPNSDVYQLDLFHGKIFKNGKEISALNPQIKKNPYFKELFGENKQFQVFQSHEAQFLRTKNYVNHQFKINQKNKKILFEFSEDGTQIRHIIKEKDGENSDEQVWVLIPRQKLIKSNVFIPKIFMQNYLAWYSQKRKCIAFRINKFQQIYMIGMVIHLQILESQMVIVKAFHITYHGNYENQDIDKICDKSTEIYDEIILRGKSVKLENIKCFKLLNRFEKPEYIYQLKNRKKGDVEYLLYRYQMKFKLEDQTRLASQTYSGYSLDHSFYGNQNSLFYRFSCLVLQKHSKDTNLLNNHNRILIISDGQVRYGGYILGKNRADIHIGSFKFQIHDFFGDLRGSTRQSLIQLASLMLSINDNIKIKSIQMTPLDYCIYLLKCCVSNRPMKKTEIQKINHIIKQLNPPQSVVLLCEALWTCSHKLQSILPFSTKKRSKNRKTSQLQSKQIHSVFSYQMEQQLMACRTIYENKCKDQIIRYRQKISSVLLNYISVPILNNTESSEQSQSEQISAQQSSDSSQQEETNKKKVKKKYNNYYYWKYLKQFNGTKYLQKMKVIKDQFKKFNKKSGQITTIWNNQLSQINMTQITISPKIYELTKNPQCNLMTKQIIQSLQNSYKQFIIDNRKNKIITKKLQEGFRKQQLKLIEQIKNDGEKILEKIQGLIQKIKKKNQLHPDVLTGVIPTISFICFTSLICNCNHIKHYFPHLDKDVVYYFWQIMKIWSQIKTRIASFDRMKVLLESETLDTISLMREALSPRKQVQDKPYWLCFETQNKVQLWSSQLDTYINLAEQSQNSGNFCQLNMGQGKTQMIIPMIILDVMYNNKGKQNRIPRINLLSSLMDEARGNFFKFLSVTGFQIPGFQIPFTREVNLTIQNIHKVRHLIKQFKSNIYILMTRESRLSEILRYYETNKLNKFISIQKEPLIEGKIYDIFDQIDALMTPLKSYIFSIRPTYSLPSSKIRFQILAVLVQIFLKNHLLDLINSGIASTQETKEVAMKFIQQGKYPPGLRINISYLYEKQLLDIRKKLAEDVIKQLKSSHFSFFELLNDEFQKNLIEYIINPLDLNLKLPDGTNPAWKDQIFILRGALGFGIFEHCLTMRCGVDYGIPSQQHEKDIAVPYEAADIPSKTSEYQHPDVSIILSYLAYYTKGLNMVQFQKALQVLQKLSKTSRLKQYDQWYKLLPQKKQTEISVKNAQQINQNSKVVIEELFEFYSHNRKVIAFWLKKCIFPSNLRQYKQSITASAWDLADVEQSVGFSGTKDNYWLYSDKLTWKPCQTPAIKGTDGKMIHLITEFTNKICLIKQSDTDQSQWERFIDTALNEQVGCIIDAGALCVGKSLQQQIVPWVAEHWNFNREKYVGISFCDQNGKWKVYEIESKHCIPRGSSIPDSKTFVIFDEARTRGADIKMNADVTAAISLGPKMTKDKFMQAAGRLRRLGRNQKLIIMATHQIFSELKQFKHVDIVDLEEHIGQFDKKDLINTILAWCVKNTIQNNEKLLVQFGTLGWNYIRSKIDKQVYIKDIKSQLNVLYEHGLERTTVAFLNQKIQQDMEPQYKNNHSGKHIHHVLSTYGKNVYRQTRNLDDVCERQVQPEPEIVKEQEDQLRDLDYIPEQDETITAQSIPDIPLVFDKKFEISENFIYTTRCYGDDLSFKEQKSRQLSELYFVKYSQNSIVAITLREASRQIHQSLILKSIPQNRISLLSNISIKDRFIKKNNLQGALVSAKLLSGVENYSQEEENYLLQIFFDSTKRLQTNSQKYEMLTEFILRKKRIYLKKYYGSTLEKLVIRLNNQAMNSSEKQKKEEQSSLKSKKNQENKIFKLQWKKPLK